MTIAWQTRRRAILRDALGIGIACGAYAVSFGAISVASGLTLLQTQVLSLGMFTGASQFALVGVLGAGGGAVAAIAIALMLGLRNGLYAMSLRQLLGFGWPTRLLAAQGTIDESTAMALAHQSDTDGDAPQRWAFWATAVSIFVLWNAGTLIGALGAAALGDPAVLGLDAAIPAGFLALLWPRLRDRRAWAIALAGALVAVILTPVLPPGLPVLAAAGVALVAAARPSRSGS